MDTDEYKEVVEWLSSVYGGEAPEFEPNPEALEVMGRLMRAAKGAERRAGLRTEELQRRSQEYEARTAQLAEALAAVGLRQGAVPPAGRRAASLLAGAALALGTEEATPPALSAALAALEVRHEQRADAYSAQRVFRDQLLSAIRQLADKLAHVEGLLLAAEETTKLEERQLAVNRQRGNFHEKKLAEYRAEVNVRKAELNYIGYCDNISHEKLQKDYEEYLKLQEEVTALGKRMETDVLSLDLPKAKLEVAKAKEELQNLVQGTTS